ncbi:MAG: toll/interleukin-1 receptor domain-containing protein, partial [Clostridia bacterium]|nr:toll/interleukin-1 receptor domain-containing protein [Clostridia bacterium]
METSIVNLDNLVECQCCGNRDASRFIPRENGYVCKCCGVWYEAQKKEGNSSTAHRLTQGYEFLNNYDFDRARNVFQRIMRDEPESIDARWGFLLAKYGVVYVKGFFNDIIEPIYCFPDYANLGGATFRGDREFSKIVELIGEDKNLLKLYNEKSIKIDRAIRNFRNSVQNVENDVFICVKISNATENAPDLKGHTEDSRFAEKLEKDLQARGVKVFYSLHTLTKEVDSDDEIWTHLVKSKKMILIGSQEDYLESTWVKSEWQRWLHLDRQNELYIFVLKHDEESPMNVLPYELRTKQIYTLDTYDKL